MICSPTRRRRPIRSARRRQSRWPAPESHDHRDCGGGTGDTVHGCEPRSPLGSDCAADGRGGELPLAAAPDRSLARCNVVTGPNGSGSQSSSTGRCDCWPTRPATAPSTRWPVRWPAVDDVGGPGKKGPVSLKLGFGGDDFRLRDGSGHPQTRNLRGVRVRPGDQDRVDLDGSVAAAVVPDRRKVRPGGSAFGISRANGGRRRRTPAVRQHAQRTRRPGQAAPELLACGTVCGRAFRPCPSTDAGAPARSPQIGTATTVLEPRRSGSGGGVADDRQRLVTWMRWRRDRKRVSG